MGNEVKGAVRIGKARRERNERHGRHDGKILLETSELIFRGPDYRLKLPFSELTNVEAANGELRVETTDGLFIFEVGPSAEKWREKILHPKTRIQKLGVKEGTSVRLLSKFDAEFMRELKASKAMVIRGTNSAEAQNAFLELDGKNSLSAVAKHAKRMNGAEALWLVYPKGKREITENDVISAGRKAGLKDIKVVGFSATHTALKFVIPIENR